MNSTDTGCDPDVEGGYAGPEPRSAEFRVDNRRERLCGIRSNGCWKSGAARRTYRVSPRPSKRQCTSERATPQIA